LRADLVADFVCRLLTHMTQTGSRRVTVQLRPEDEDMPLLPWIDPENLNPRYLVRGMHAAPSPNGSTARTTRSEKGEFPAIELAGPEFSYT
jgi:hypothetical protein